MKTKKSITIRHRKDHLKILMNLLLKHDVIYNYHHHPALANMFGFAMKEIIHKWHSRTFLMTDSEEVTIKYKPIYGSALWYYCASAIDQLELPPYDYSVLIDLTANLEKHFA